MTATLEPLALKHHDALQAAAADGELWRLWYTTVPAPETTRAYIETALDMRARLGAMPFVVRQTSDGAVIGTTRYFNVDESNQRLEIGHTWYARRVQRTSGVNPELNPVRGSPAIGSSSR